MATAETIRYDRRTHDMGNERIASSSMTPATSLDDFCRRPLGRYVSGRSYLLWAATPTLVGTVYFARPAEDEWSELLRVTDVARHSSLRPPYDAIVDAGGLDDLPTEAFEALLEYLRYVTGYAPIIRRVGIVRPRGFVGAALTGLFYEAVRARFHAALFQERAEAFAWLGRHDAHHVERALSSIIESVRATPLELRRLRDHLSGVRGDSDLHRASRALGLADRSLQRHLREAGTSFRVEVDRVRMASAERLLLAGDDKIDVVARRAGFASASHLARAFRKATGETPAEFRRRRRS